MGIIYTKFSSKLSFIISELAEKGACCSLNKNINFSIFNSIILGVSQIAFFCIKALVNISQNKGTKFFEYLMV